MSEGDHMHHAGSKSDMSAFVLPLSILLAAVILGYSMMSAATTVNNGLLSFANTAGSLAGAGANAAAPTPTPDQGNLAPTVTKTMAELTATDYAGKFGSDSAPVVMVEYSDFQCPFCRRYYEDTHKELMTKYVDTGKVQIFFKDFPLSFHPMATPYANAGRCAAEQGKFLEMHDKMFDEQQKASPDGSTNTTITDADIKQWAVDLGLNATQFNSCYDAKKFQSNIDKTYAEGASVGVNGTPSFIIGKRDAKGQLIVGAQPTATFETTIDALLA